MWASLTAAFNDIVHQIGALTATPAGVLVWVIGALGLIAAVAALARVRHVQNIVLAVPALYLFLIGLFGPIFWAPARAVTSLFGIVVDGIASGILLIPVFGSSNGLVLGNRRLVAEWIWPPALYPDLYARVPEDIVRPVYEDGRLLGGIPVDWLADRFLTLKAYRTSMRMGFTAGVVLLIVLALQSLIFIAGYAYDYIDLYRSGLKPVIEHWPGMGKTFAGNNLAIRMYETAFLAQYHDQVRFFFQYLPGQILMAFGVFVISALMLLNDWFRGKTAPYKLLTKDAEVRWPHRIESRNLVRQAYLRQISLAVGYLKDAPTFLVGHATGILRIRGDLAGPSRGQPIKLDQESLFQHTLVFGGTGEGKTTALLKPLMRQVLSNKSFGALVADAKGVLWGDALRVAEDTGRKNDVVLVGTGADQFGVNVVADLSPSQIAAALRSVLTQIGNAGPDSFWPDMAAGIIRHMLTLGAAYAKTEAGTAETKNGLSPYSLWWAYQAVLRREVSENAIAQLHEARKALLDKVEAATSKNEVDSLLTEAEQLMPPELSDTIVYLGTAWKEMAPETKTGIIANVTQLMDGFASSAVLRERFASGRQENCISMRQALDGKIVLNTLSSIEDGLPARLVSILIKTSLYREARQREANWKRDGKGPAPQSKPCLVVMDEVQELATSDASSGLSDASFWNVARSTGLAGLFATQTLAALRQSMGEDGADNFVQQARSKIFFRTEEKATVEYAIWCAGSYERNRVYGKQQRESIEYREMIDGWNPLAPIDDSDFVENDPRRLRSEASAFFSSDRRTLTQVSAAPAFEPNLSFVPAPVGNNAATANANYLAALSAQQAAYWRAEDLTRQYLSEGNETEAALTVSDIIHMGRWHAFAHIQRAGAARQDIIVVQHDFS